MENEEIEKEIFSHLKCVIDPELMVNIVDLGLVYELHHILENQTIKVEMTLTSKGCPMGDVIMQNVEEILKANYPNYTIDVQLVWEPEWTTEMMSLEGRKALE
ncbi:MAG: metal-sulfur cluster assembly factor [Flavobacteriia bacterium]|nr:metal-sulfur cluster assembly factor [Flavobacteriia bacterium]